MLYEVTYSAECIYANTRPHQLVNGRWSLLSHAQKAVRWLALSIGQAEAP